MKTFDEKVYLSCYAYAAKDIHDDIKNNGYEKAKASVSLMISYWRKNDHNRVAVNAAFVDARLDAFGL